MLRTTVAQVSKTGFPQHVRAFATPASRLSSNTPLGPLATDGTNSMAGASRPHRDGVTNNYWEPKPANRKPEKAAGDEGAKDNEEPIRKGVMQNLFF